MKDYLEQDIYDIDLKTLVIDALNEALTNEEELNVGIYTDRCDDDIKKYYTTSNSHIESYSELIESFKNDRDF